MEKLISAIGALLVVFASLPASAQRPAERSLAKSGIDRRVASRRQGRQRRAGGFP